ncbi:hypothetical protein Tco_0241072 [Tanacetum coccineum]
MKKLKESVYAIRVGCQICEGPHLDKDCPLNEEVKQVEEVRYGEFRRTTPFNRINGGKFRLGPPGYYTKTDNRLPYGKRRQSLKELLAKHQEESARRSSEIEEYCNQVHNNNYGWLNHEFEKEEREEMGVEDEDYHPPEVQVETFEVKKYSFEGDKEIAGRRR